MGREKFYFIGSTGSNLGMRFGKNGTNDFCAEEDRDSMTAIVSAYTDNGFVMGADSRAMRGDEIISERTKKLFDFKFNQGHVIYGWRGLVRGMGEIPGTFSYDLVQATQDALKISSDLAGNDILIFHLEICKHIRKVLFESSATATINNFNSIAAMLLEGYFDGSPFATEIHIRQTDHVVVRPENVRWPVLEPTKNFFSGCPEQDKAYRDIIPANTLEALKFVSEYIQDCIDNPNCFIVGGQRQTVVLTPDGVSWVDRLKPDQLPD